MSNQVNLEKLVAKRDALIEAVRDVADRDECLIK